MVLGAVFVPRNAQEAIDQAIIDSFLEKAASLGMQHQRLGLHALGGGLLGFLHTAGTYGVSWEKEMSITIPGILSFTLSMPRHGVFTKYQADKVLMSVQAEGFRQPLSRLREIEEAAVLAEEVDPILVVKVAGHWFEVYRWLKRPDT